MRTSPSTSPPEKAARHPGLSQLKNMGGEAWRTCWKTIAYRTWKKRRRLEDYQTAEQVQQKASFLWSFLHELWSSPHFSSRASSAYEEFFTSSANASWRACHKGMTNTPASSLGGCINQQGLWNCHATLAMMQKNSEEVDNKMKSRVCNSGRAECVDQAGSTPELGNRVLLQTLHSPNQSWPFTKCGTESRQHVQLFIELLS